MKMKSKGGTSPFRAVTVALAGTLGVGNISGVAVALSLGGAGAIFWMWISAFLAMIVKYSEIVLAVYHREKSNGEIHGGAMYYIKKGINKKGLASIIATFFALFCIFSSLTTGSIIQINAAAEAAYASFRTPPIIIGIIIALLSAVSLFGKKASKISEITVRLVPAMTLIFICLSLTVIFTNIKQIPNIFTLIIRGAFSQNSAIGGILGYIFSKGVRFGVTKGLFSNEAGCGTSTIAHAQANNTSPSAQGVWGIFEVFFDTIVLCTMTAFVLLLNYSDSVPDVGGGVTITLSAYTTQLGPIANTVLSISIILFAFATILCWAYYGCECVRFITKRKYAIDVYLIIYLLSIIYGASAPSSLVWEIADLSICIMMSINTICICQMSETVVKLSEKEGEADSFTFFFITRKYQIRY